jgi:hypothetical protein
MRQTRSAGGLESSAEVARESISKEQFMLIQCADKPWTKPKIEPRRTAAKKPKKSRSRIRTFFVSFVVLRVDVF